MRLIYALHILTAGLALVSGYLALSVSKGATLHRKSGILFVYTMLTTAVFGMIISAARDVAPAVNFPAGLLTSYLVITSLSTLRPPARGSRVLAVGAMLLALAVGLASLTFGLEAIANGGTRNEIPPFPFFTFGLVALLGAAGDLRVIRSGVLLRGAPRIARHLWRMSFALFIAAISFFLGQAQVIPKPIRIPALLALPVLAVLVTMFYWLGGSGSGEACGVWQ
jgi:uncharacterized membrane protein